MKQTVVLGITGGIAAYKSADLTSRLVKLGYNVEIIMTANACKFIQPLTFSTLTKNLVYTDTFERIDDSEVKHIELAKQADLFVIVPATANTIAKIAHGMADDMLTSTFLAAKCKKIICPAMNTNMYTNPITEQNINKCKQLGMDVIEPASGVLACGDTGKGKLASVDIIINAINNQLQIKQTLTNKNVLITAGPTQESIDPVRFITNHSSGKMGYALAQQAQLMGATVTLITGPTNLEYPKGVHIVNVTSAQEMFDAVKQYLPLADYIIKAAAVGDYYVEHIASEKIKKTDDIITLQLKKTQDILHYVGHHKLSHQIVCGFAMETNNLIENAQKKLNKKNCDLIVANHLFTQGAGFKQDTNVASIITKDEIKNYKLMSKVELSTIILTTMQKIEKEKHNLCY